MERFAPVPTATTGQAEAFEVELARAVLTLTVPADHSIPETVERAGGSVDFSCREGTCGTCETDVLDGKPDHRDSLLTEDERAAATPCSSASPARAGLASSWICDGDHSGQFTRTS